MLFFAREERGLMRGVDWTVRSSTGGDSVDAVDCCAGESLPGFGARDANEAIRGESLEENERRAIADEKLSQALGEHSAGLQLQACPIINFSVDPSRVSPSSPVV